MAQERIYVESYDDVQSRRDSTLKNATNNIPSKQLGYFAVIVFLAVFLAWYTGKLDIKWLWITLAGIVVVMILLSMQTRDSNSHITELEAKSILLTDLRFLKRSQTREFDGLMGRFETHGECYHDNSYSNPKKWVWVIGWRHILPNGRKKFYTAQVYSLYSEAKVRALSVSMGRYLGEEMITSVSEKAPQPGPREINYYLDRSNNPGRIM